MKNETVFKITRKDCIKGMQQLPDSSVDIVVTSPPYNLGIKYSSYKDSRSQANYFKWCRKWAAEVKRVLKGDGSFFLNLGSASSNQVFPHQFLEELKPVDFKLQNTFHWIKSITVETKDGQLVSVGHFKPIQSKRFVNDCHEYVFHLTKPGSIHANGRDRRSRENNWFIPYKTINSREKERPHPATFPVALAVNCIKVHGCRPDLVMLDPFVGIGHSAVAAKQCGIGTFIGFDVDREYVKVAKKAVQELDSTKENRNWR